MDKLSPFSAFDYPEQALNMPSKMPQDISPGIVDKVVTILSFNHSFLLNNPTCIDCAFLIPTEAKNLISFTLNVISIKKAVSEKSSEAPVVYYSARLTFLRLLKWIFDHRSCNHNLSNWEVTRKKDFRGFNGIRTRGLWRAGHWFIDFIRPWN